LIVAAQQSQSDSVMKISATPDWKHVMDLFLDTNIIIDHLCKREPFYQASRTICLLGISQEAKTYVSVSMLTDVYYLLAKDRGSQAAQDLIEDGLGFLQYVGISPEDARQALAARWPDFEDCLVSLCAEKVKADYIVTRNPKDFKLSRIPAVTPEELLEKLKAQGITYAAFDF